MTRCWASRRARTIVGSIFASANSALLIAEPSAVALISLSLPPKAPKAVLLAATINTEVACVCIFDAELWGRDGHVMCHVWFV